MSEYLPLIAGCWLGATIMGLTVAAWSWWAEVRPEVSWAAFWRPVRDLSMHGRPWLKVHVLAHLIGGVVIGAVLLSLDIRPRWAPELSLTATWWLRLLWILPAQALWERVQHENFESWREVLIDGVWVTRPISAYPWWSAVWDVQITLAGWLVAELGWLLLQVVMR